MTEELVVLKAVHPTWCNLQLPRDVAQILGLVPGVPFQTVYFHESQGRRARVAVTREEDMNSRPVASAQLTEKMVFNLPTALANHLGIQISRTKRGRATDDMVVWFTTADHYHELRRATRGGRRPTGLSSGKEPKIYVSRNWPG